MTSISESVTTYNGSADVQTIENAQFKVFPNPSSDLLVVQFEGLNQSEINAELIDQNGKVIQTQSILPGSTLCYFDVKTIYAGTYFVKLTTQNLSKTYTISIE